MIERPENTVSLDPVNFVMYDAPAGRVVKVGPRQLPVALPAIPLPVHREVLEEGEPSDDAIGQGIYDYMRQFPDCPRNGEYALLLRDAFPHFISDLAAQIVMLDYKDVDVPYIRRQIAYMKILLLLDPGNAGLLHQLGKACLEVGLTFSNLPNVRYDLLKALGYFQQALKRKGDEPATLNYLAQIDYWLGDYPGCLRRWEGVLRMLPESPARVAIESKVRRIEDGEVPDHPLIDDLEQIGQAMTLYDDKVFEGALDILEDLERRGDLFTEFPMPEFFCLLGLCREKLGDPGGAFVAYEKALELDPFFEEALRGKDRIAEGG